MIPVSVVGGYLGAGKTTLLNALLRTSSGVRYAVLVNDFGSVNVDAALIAASGQETLELTNGCTCCTIGGDLILALKSLVARETPPDRIVIEASGVADPRAVARIADCHPALAVHGTIVVVDTETIRERVADKYVGGLVRRQLGAADVLVLSRGDVLSPEQRAAVHAWLAEEAPRIPLLEAINGAGVAPELLFDREAIGEIRGDAADGDRPPAFVSASFRREAPVDRERFLAAVRDMLPTVARAKGTVRFADAPDQPYVVQLAGARWSIEPSGAPIDAMTSIVAIAFAERAAALDAAIDAMQRA